MAEFINPQKLKQRDTAIDFVKFSALFLVLNSHMGICYPKYQFLATGGAIGDSLFFFASGFTLFLGSREVERFDEWYKRRIRRIYPSLIAVAILGAIFFGIDDTFIDVIVAKRYWFVQCIFLLYPFLYVAKRYVTNHLLLLFGLTLVTMAIFPFIHYGNYLFWGGGYYRWSVYLLFMLLGAIIGEKRESFRQMNVWLSICLTGAFIIAWYCIIYFFGKSSLHVISIFPMMGVVVSFYCIGTSKPFERLMHSQIGYVIISIGALCLESYLIQKMIITSDWNSLFPWNIPIIMLLVLIASYVTKLLANLIGQVFDSQPLDWHRISKLY